MKRYMKINPQCVGVELGWTQMILRGLKSWLEGCDIIYATEESLQRALKIGLSNKLNRS